MASTAAFVAQCPEFAAVDTALLDVHLAAAALEVDAPTWGRFTDQGVIYLAAHKLALSPFGMAAKLVAKDGTTTYLTHFRRLAGIVTQGLRTT